MTTRGEIVRAQLGSLRGDIELRSDEFMSRHTTLRLGGPADVWARPADDDALGELLAACFAAAIPVTFIGGGTNLLVRDGGLRGVVVNPGRMNRVSRPDPVGESDRVEVEAGASTGRLLKCAIEWERGGVEFLAGVPGSVGGGLVMNAGTYLGEFVDVVTEVRSRRRDGSKVRRERSECGFRYRGSDLPSDEIIVGASLSLPARDRDAILADVGALRARRDEREPKGVPNNGSTFKNPMGDHAGRLIEVAGLKGVRRGGAVVSPKHANWLVVDRSYERPCTAADLLALIEHVREVVARVHGVVLENEVKVIGEEATPS
jgi:UDP-N-acetylmuramate dehydrogenase